MEIQENVPLASITTFKVGGAARYVAACGNEDDIKTAITYARDRGLPWYVIGGGSNILASDAGYAGVIIRPVFNEMKFEDQDANLSQARTLAIVDAGVSWDAFVQESVQRGLWGVENLAGIPGSVGAAPVQNIGAYGADVSDTLSYVEAFDTEAGKVIHFSKEACKLGYRDSRFKHDPAYIILRVAFELSMQGTTRTNYADIHALISQGVILDTPQEVADAVRQIRAQKFPDLRTSGTAGSFFKNPIVTQEAFNALRETYPELPGFPAGENIKIPLAWILDHILSLRGFSKGSVRLFERQPLVLVAESGATAHDVDSFAKEIEARVREATSIVIEREVRELKM